MLIQTGMSRSSKIGAAVLVLLSLTAIGIASYLALTYNQQASERRGEALEAARSEAAVAAAEIVVPFAVLKSIADVLADDLSDGTLAYEDIEARLFDDMQLRPEIDGLAITFEPFVYDPDTRLFQTYVYQTEDGSYDSLVGATYDYTVPPDQTNNATGWYVNTINEGARWLEPFFATGAQKVLVEYAVPFYPVGADPETAAPAGIVTIDATVDTIRTLIRDLELGAKGYGFVMSPNGTYLSHPISEFPINRSIFDTNADNPELLDAAEAALNRQRSFAETVDPVTGAPTWYVFEPISITGWTLGLALAVDQFEPDPRETIRQQTSVAIAVAASLFFLAATVFHSDHYRFTDFWWMSVVFSMLCTGLIIMIGTLTNRLDLSSGIRINSLSELDRYVSTIAVPASGDGTLHEIPTGVLIQSMQFPDPTAVTINGYIWQRYDVDSPLPRGFTLPARIGEEATLEEVQREVVDGEELIVWYVGVTLRQTFNTVRFPFDHRNIVIRLTPAALDENVLLTPDLDAYELTNPRLRPGLDPLVDINNWTLRTSGFSYTTQRTNTNLGFDNREASRSIPELRFEIQAQRIYLGAFIAYLLPGMIAAIMTFTYLVSDREPGNKDEIVNVLNYTAALFFVVAIIHTAMREQIAAVGVTYLEYLFIILYLAVIGVATNVYIVARYPNWGIVRYRNNIVPKVLYWPIFAGGMLLATLLIFVY